jgi:hypothetical protein
MLYAQKCPAAAELVPPASRFGMTDLEGETGCAWLDGQPESLAEPVPPASRFGMTDLEGEAGCARLDGQPERMAEPVPPASRFGMTDIRRRAEDRPAGLSGTRRGGGPQSVKRGRDSLEGGREPWLRVNEHWPDDPSNFKYIAEIFPLK